MIQIGQIKSGGIDLPSDVHYNEGKEHQIKEQASAASGRRIMENSTAANKKHMKNSAKWCWVISGIFVLTFAFTCLMDYLHYKAYANSAPYWAFVAARAIEFLIPAFGFGIAALIIQARKS